MQEHVAAKTKGLWTVMTKIRFCFGLKFSEIVFSATEQLLYKAMIPVRNKPVIKIIRIYHKVFLSMVLIFQEAEKAIIDSCNGM